MNTEDQKNEQEETVIETILDRDIYAVTLMANRSYPGYTQTRSRTTYIITKKTDEHEIRDSCMEMCYEAFPKKHEYTGHDIGFCLIPRKYDYTYPDGEYAKYRIDIIQLGESTFKSPAPEVKE